MLKIMPRKTLFSVSRLLVVMMMIINSYHSLYAEVALQIDEATLAPHLSLQDQGGVNTFYTSTLLADTFIFDWDNSNNIIDNSENQILNDLGYLNTLYRSVQGNRSDERIIKFILEDKKLTEMVSALIRAQDRMENTPYGIGVDRAWAEAFKDESLRRAVETLEGRDIFFLQMEYELSVQFLVAFKAHLIKDYLMVDDGTPFEERRIRANKLAVYASGQLAKLQMAGGLGSFKPDMVRGFYNDLKKFWGADKARNRLHVMGVFYAKTIKGEGDLVRDVNLNPVVEKIRQVKGIEDNVQQRV